MRHLLLILLTFGLFSCNQQIDNTADLQKRIDSLESKLENTYIPHFGDFMSGIQAHHAKLWFAGQNENWDLADFEIHELEEAIEDIQKYHAGRKETELIGMILPALDSVEVAIEKKDPVSFKRNYNLLTNTCNKCHHQTDHGFVVIKLPESLPYTNQDFEPLK